MANTAFRWGGMLLMVSATLLGVANVIISFNPMMDKPFSPGISLLLLLSAILLLLSLPAMYARQANAAGWLGLVGHGLLQTGILLLVGVAAPALFYPSLNQAPGESLAAFLLGIALTLGLLLTAISTMRARVYPRWAGILLLAATVGFFFDFFVAEFLPPVAGQLGAAILGVLLALALAWNGFALWSEQRSQPSEIESLAL